jgi:hypothetical protein
MPIDPGTPRYHWFLASISLDWLSWDALQLGRFVDAILQGI